MTVTSHQRSQERSPRPEFPYWPFSCLALYTQVARDFGGYAEAVARSNDAMDTMRAEADFGARLFADLMRGYYDLALAPWTAMASTMAAEALKASPPLAEDKATLRRPRGLH